MLQVWADGKKAGVLDRLPYGGSTFAYDPSATPTEEVSLTLPLRVQSYDRPRGLTPIFDMNLPEGALREQLRLRFAKATGDFDDFDLLGIVGRSHVGRVGFSAVGEDLNSEIPFQSVDEILRAKRGGELYDYLVNTFATHSGISGVQPKVLIRAEEQARSFRTATHIVKFWDKRQYPELAANEFFCLKVAERIGLTVPSFELSETGDALVVRRFDLPEDGKPLGFEDFCVLNGLSTSQKYKGGYEASLFKRLREFISPALLPDALERAFTLFVLNAAVRNGDAHLKNWGVTYANTRSDVSLAPVYDVVTTTAYIPKDQMALTLDGSPEWPDAKKLTKLGKVRADLGGPAIERIFIRIADAMADVSKEMSAYFRASANPEAGAAISDAWQAGIRNSLGVERSFSVPSSAPQ